MTPVFQNIADSEKGNCFQASTASLLDLDLDQVPNFIKYNQELYHQVFNGFLASLGYDWMGTGYAYYDNPTFKKKEKEKLKKYNVGGLVLAAVPSKNFDDVYHSVVMDTRGIVAHDPSLEKSYLGENIIKTKKLQWWYLIDKN